MHLQMQNIGKMLSIAIWTLSCQMVLGRSLIVQMGANQLDVSGSDCLNGCKPIGCK
jgi:hypothetical protein